MSFEKKLIKRFEDLQLIIEYEKEGVITLSSRNRTNLVREMEYLRNLLKKENLK